MQNIVQTSGTKILWGQQTCPFFSKNFQAVAIFTEFSSQWNIRNKDNFDRKQYFCVILRCFTDSYFASFLCLLQFHTYSVKYVWQLSQHTQRDARQILKCACVCVCFAKIVRKKETAKQALQIFSYTYITYTKCRPLIFHTLLENLQKISFHNVHIWVK